MRGHQHQHHEREDAGCTGAVAVKDRVEGIALVLVGLVRNAQLVLLVIPVALSAGVSSATTTTATTM